MPVEIYVVSTWRIEICREMERLEGEIAQFSAAVPPPPGLSMAARYLARAKRYIKLSNAWSRRILNWWSGTQTEAAWKAVQLGDEALVRLRPIADLQADLAELDALITSNLPAGDPRIKEYQQRIGQWERSGFGAHPDNARAEIATMRRAAHEASDLSYEALRNFRNALIQLGLALLLFLVGLGVWHALDHTFISIQYSRGSADVFQLEGAGALGAFVAAAVAFGKMTGFSGPYDPRVWQSLFRIPTGIAAALLGALVLHSNLLGTGFSGDVYAYAAVFGYAPNVFLGGLDQRAEKLVAPARGKNESPS